MRKTKKATRKRSLKLPTLKKIIEFAKSRDACTTGIRSIQSYAARGVTTAELLKRAVKATQKDRGVAILNVAEGRLESSFYWLVSEIGTATGNYVGWQQRADLAVMRKLIAGAIK